MRAPGGEALKTGDQLRSAALALFSKLGPDAMLSGPTLASEIGADDWTELETILAHPIAQGYIKARRVGAAVWFSAGVPEAPKEITDPDDYDSWPVRQVVGVQAKPGCAIECGGLTRKETP